MNTIMWLVEGLLIRRVEYIGREDVAVYVKLPNGAVINKVLGVTVFEKIEDAIASVAKTYTINQVSIA